MLTWATVATIDTGRKEGGCCAPFVDTWEPVEYKAAWAEVYFRTNWRLRPSSRLATIKIDRKLGHCPLFGEGSWVPI